MLSGFVVFLLVIIVLLAVPVTLTYRVTWQRSFQSNMTLQWLFGLVRIQLPSTASTTTDRAQETVTITEPKKLPASRKANPMIALRQKAFRQRLFRLIGDLWHAVHKQHVTLRIRIGLGDPADTGQLWALVGPLSGMLATIQDAMIEIEPEFIDTVFELDSSGKIRIIPLQLLYLAFGLLLSPAFWRGVNQMRNAAK
ncbi:MAG: DUF2953 domain-containing protein [Gammaproteobacteria bacterium]|nr:DUF2953 domain-containing protein [Gammaproteobacteria bacterium]NNJ96903.1 DUF2953 domain-containing protein [Gammaproteobacteria bacterium]